MQSELLPRMLSPDLTPNILVSKVYFVWIRANGLLQCCWHNEFVFFWHSVFIDGHVYILVSVWLGQLKISGQVMLFTLILEANI